MERHYERCEQSKRNKDTEWIFKFNTWRQVVQKNEHQQEPLYLGDTSGKPL